MSGDNCVPKEVSKQVSPSVKSVPATKGKKNACSTFTKSSQELWVFWKIENFSDLGLFHGVDSAPFSLRCGPETMDTQKFYMTFNPSHPPLIPGVFRLLPFQKKGSLTTETQPPLLRVSFSAMLANGEYHNFHDKGRILDGLKVKDCSVYSRRFSFLQKNGKSPIPDGSMTILAKFWSDEPVFEVARVIIRTQLEINYLRNPGFDIKTEDLLKGICVIHAPGKLTDLKFRTVPNSEANENEIVVLLRNFTGFPCFCDINLRNGTEELVKIEDFSVLTTASGFFVLPAKLSEKYTFSFNFIVDNREREMQVNFDSDGNNELNLQNLAAMKDTEAVCDKKDIDYLKKAEKSHSTCSADATKGKSIKNADLKVDLVSDLQNLYSQHIFSDFTLKVGDRSFAVHRGILSARSEVFRAMFEEEDMLEKRDNCSEVTDVDEDTMERMLRFVYSNELEDQDVDSLVKLFQAAVKYQIESLKSRCVESLEANLSGENVCGVLSLADIQSDQTLMLRAKTFLFRNSEAVFRSEGWRQFMERRSELACSLMHDKLVDQQPRSQDQRSEDGTAAGDELKKCSSLLKS